MTLLINNCDTAGVKFASGFSRTSNSYFIAADQVYLGSAVVSQINVVCTGTYNAAGNMTLYGAK